MEVVVSEPSSEPAAFAAFNSEFLFAVPIFGYALAYAYEAGAYFEAGAPNSFIVVSIPQIFMGCLSVAVPLMGIAYASSKSSQTLMDRGWIGLFFLLLFPTLAFSPIREPWHAGAGGPAGRLRSGGADARAGVAALERATLVLAEAAPHSVVLAGLEGPGKTLFAYLTATADLLGLLDLEDRGTGVADGEEQLRVLVEACGAAAPIHGWGDSLFHIASGCCLRTFSWARAPESAASLLPA